MAGTVRSAPAWVCPEHHVELSEREDALSCSVGRDQFPVLSGIPRFVVGGSYAKAFGTQWHRYPKTQLDSHSGVRISAERARRCLGDELWEDLSGLQVLEVGCGAGRFTEVLLERGAVVTSVDLSSAVEVNAVNFPINSRHRVAQADVMRLPFEPRGFDVVFCLGVVQHTPAPEAAIAKLYEQVRSGGWLVIDHYIRTWRWYTRTAPLFRAYLRRLPPDRGIRACERLVDVLRPLHLRTRSPLGRVLLNRLSPITVYDDVYPELPERLQREWAMLDTHDMLTDHYKHRRNVGEIRRTLTGLGMEQVWCAEGGNGVEARGRRPRSSD